MIALRQTSRVGRPIYYLYPTVDLTGAWERSGALPIRKKHQRLEWVLGGRYVSKSALIRYMLMWL